MSAALGTRLAFAGLSSRRPWVAALLGVLAVLVASLLERSGEPAYAADRALLGPTLKVIVPLVCYALFEAVYRAEPARAVLDPIARHGADRRLLSLGTNGALALCSAGVAAVLAALAALAARGFADPDVFADAVASFWGGALVGAAYGGLFAVASLFGRRGRIAALVLDWLFGSGTGTFALVFPRGHARNLFGGEPVLQGSQAFAALVLAALAASLVLLAAARETR
ncbi:MAG TPA: hypothetical protein VFZ53_16110 [Polyangiaceae bacterium]